MRELCIVLLLLFLPRLHFKLTDQRISDTSAGVSSASVRVGGRLGPPGLPIQKIPFRADERLHTAPLVKGQYVAVFNNKPCDVEAGARELAQDASAVLEAKRSHGSFISAQSSPRVGFKILRQLGKSAVHDALSTQRLAAAAAAAGTATQAAAGAPAVVEQEPAASPCASRMQRRQRGVVLQLDDTPDLQDVLHAIQQSSVTQYVVQDRLVTSSTVIPRQHRLLQQSQQQQQQQAAHSTDAAKSEAGMLGAVVQAVTATQPVVTAAAAADPGQAVQLESARDAQVAAAAAAGMPGPSASSLEQQAEAETAAAGNTMDDHMTAAVAVPTAVDAAAMLVQRLGVSARSRPKAGGCKAVDQLSSGEQVFPGSVKKLQWTGCATASNEVKWLGRRCSHSKYGFNAIQYAAIYAIAKRTGHVATYTSGSLKGQLCILRPRSGSSNSAWNLQRFGTCGSMENTYASDLPATICPASAETSGCIEPNAATGATEAAISLPKPVMCSGKSNRKVTLVGELCGPGGNLIQWTTAKARNGCKLQAGEGAYADLKAQMDLFGSCGMPPAWAPNLKIFVCQKVVDCEGTWSDWGQCSASCGAGTRSSTFTILQQAQNGGFACNIENGATKAETCYVKDCPPVPGMNLNNKLPEAAVGDGQIVPTGLPRIEAARTEGGVIYVVDVTAVPAEKQVVVGVIDSGIDETHPDLNYVGGTTFTEASPDHPADSASPGVDHYGHGTHVAGIIGAKNNNIGTVGVSPGIGVYSLKVLDGNGRGTLSQMVEAVAWAAEQGMALGIKVLNLSLAAYLDPTSPDYEATRAYICDTMKTASDAGIAVVVAAGNYGADLHYYLPANCYGIASATAVDNDGSEAASYSNYLPEDPSNPKPTEHYLLAAPGTGIFSTISFDKDVSGYRELSGTSMAAPHVASLCATCIMSGECDAGTGYEKLTKLEAAAKAKLRQQAGYGFAGDPRSQSNGRIYGYLVWDGW